jgi:hypothetical protein
MTNRKRVNWAVLRLFEKIAQSHYEKAIKRITIEEKQRERIAQYSPVFFLKKVGKK